MSASLTRAQIEAGDVVRVERLGDLIELTVALPHLAATARPGEFAQLRCGDGVAPLLRRPFSVAWVDGDDCGFVFEVVGAGTRLLGSLAPGATLDVLGPLGSGFDLERAGERALVVSGGVGCAPFPFLVRALAERGVDDVVVLSGASTASRLYPASRLRRGSSAEVREITDDGSIGDRGRVTDLVASTLDAAPRSVFACGPNRMLAALWSELEGHPWSRSAQASLEAPMGCGFGTCLGCALPRRQTEAATSGWLLCCSDGPVVPMPEIDWATLAALPGADVA